MQITTAPATLVPAQVVYNAFAAELSSLPGTQVVGWSVTAPDEIRLRFANDGFRRLADNVLRDTIDGVRLVLRVDPGAPAPTPGGDAWADSAAEMRRAVLAIPGVVSAHPSQEHGLKQITFATHEADVTARIRRLVNDRLGEFHVNFWTRPLPKPTPPPGSGD